MGEPAYQASIEDFARACGIKRVFTIDPYKFKETLALIKESLESPEATVIISRSPCVVDDKSALKPAKHIDTDVCRKCKACLKIGCPAIEFENGVVKINNLLCGGCELCKQICPFGAIKD